MFLDSQLHAVVIYTIAAISFQHCSSLGFQAHSRTMWSQSPYCSEVCWCHSAPLPEHSIISYAHLWARPPCLNNTGEAWGSFSVWWNIQRNSDFSCGQAQGECHLGEQWVLCGWKAVSGSQGHSWRSFTRASKRQHQRSDLKCEKESIIILQNEAFSNMANVTGSWQHDFRFILSERVPLQGWDKKPWYAILWNGKIIERQPWGIQT